MFTRRIEIREQAHNTRLTSFDAIDQETSNVEDDLPLIHDLIEEATDVVENITNRKFSREKVSEHFQGNRRTTIALSRIPVLEIEAVEFDGDSQELDDIEIQDPSAGIIYNAAKWLQLGPVTFPVEMAPLPDRGELLWKVDYTTGWLLPEDDIKDDTNISADSSDNSFSISSGEFPILVEDDRIWVSGFSASGLNKSYTVKSRTTSKIVVKEDLSDTEAEGNDITIEVRNLPRDIERAVKDVVRSTYFNRTVNPNIQRESVMDSSVTYRSSSVADSLSKSSVLARWKKKF